jgi:site-specific recombinase XerD
VATRVTPGSTPALDLPFLLLSWEVSLKAEHRAPNTIQSYLRGVRFYLAWCDENGYERQLTKPFVRAWVAELLEESEANTARVRQAAVRRFSAWLAQEGELADDPLLGLKQPKVPVKVTRCLTDDECARLIKACSHTTYRGGAFMDRRDEALLRLMLETGMRAGEVVGLRVADVDLQRSVLLVRKAKGAKQRLVSFGPTTARALDRYLRSRRTHTLAHTSALWLGALSRDFSYHGLRCALQKRGDLAGIKDFHPHLLRHTFASRWLGAGGTEGGLMATAGWSNREMIDRYSAATASERAMAEAQRLRLGELC